MTLVKKKYDYIGCKFTQQTYWDYVPVFMETIVQ